jgi:hypothetical protein
MGSVDKGDRETGGMWRGSGCPRKIDFRQTLIHRPPLGITQARTKQATKQPTKQDGTGSLRRSGFGYLKSTHAFQ